MSRARYQDAAATFHKFFSAGGKDLDASFQYARALKQMGRLDEAGQYLRYVSRAGTDAVMRAAAQSEYDKLHNKYHTVTVNRGIASVPSHN